MNWSDATLETFTSGDWQLWHSLFNRIEFHQHFCLCLFTPTDKTGKPALHLSTIFLSDPARHFSLEKEELPAQAFLIWFDLDSEDDLRPLLSLLAQRGSVNIYGPLQEQLSTFQKLWTADVTSELRKKSLGKMLESVLYAISAFVIEENNDSTPVIQRALSYMEANFMQDLDLQKISHIVGVSQEHLIRIFKKELHTTPMKYFSELRLRKSLVMLQRGNSISDIVMEMNFCNESHYCRIFKNCFGMTPGTYKKKHTKDLKKRTVLINKQLMLTSSLLTEFIDTMSDFVFVKDSNFTTIVCNKAYTELAGRPVKEILGKTDYELFPESAANFFRMSDKVVFNARTDRLFRKWLDFPDGSRKLFETRKTPYFDEEGNLLGIICIGRHLTDAGENTYDKVY